jgi:hypothetical protein
MDVPIYIAITNSVYADPSLIDADTLSPSEFLSAFAAYAAL